VRFWRALDVCAWSATVIAGRT